MLHSALSLPAAVAELVESVDGQPPAPYVRGVVLTTPGTVALTPDRRASHAVLVGLSMRQILPQWPAGCVMDLTVGGVSLVEGALPLEAISEVASGVPQQLQAPVVMASSTPLLLRAADWTGTPIASAALVRSAWVYCSARAAKAVAHELGRARWWGVSVADVPGDQQATLNVERGGRVRWLAGIGLDSTTKDPVPAAPLIRRLSLDGREMASEWTPTVGVRVPGPAAGQVSPSPLLTPELAHLVEAGQIYDWRTERPVGTSGFVWLHGAEDLR